MTVTSNLRRACSRAFIGALLPLLATTALTGCEATADVARKPALIENMVQTSLKKCPDITGVAEYLPRIFNEVPAKQLDTLIENGITVCFDNRLVEQKYGEDYDIAVGVYYGKSKVISLTPYKKYKWNESTGGYQSTSSMNRDRFLLLSFAKSIREERRIDLKTDFVFAGYYKGCAGKCTHLGWDPGKLATWEDNGKIFKVSPSLAKPLVTRPSVLRLGQLSGVNP